jgi:Mrp family chromosome partitioning ATPase
MSTDPDDIQIGIYPSSNPASGGQEQEEEIDSVAPQHGAENGFRDEAPQEQARREVVIPRPRLPKVRLQERVASEVSRPENNSVAEVAEEDLDDFEERTFAHKAIDLIIDTLCFIRFVVQFAFMWKWSWTWMKERDEARRYAKIRKIKAAFNNNGGSGKTTITVFLALARKSIVKREVLVIDTNDAEGGTARRLGVSRNQTLKTRDFVKRLRASQITTNDLVDEIAVHDDSGVRIIASARLLKQDDTTEAEIISGLSKLGETFHTVYCDPGNPHKNPGNFGAAAAADTLIFVGNVNMWGSVHPIPTRMQRLRARISHQRIVEDDDVKNTMDAYTELGFPEKVRNSVIVVIGGKTRHRNAYATHYGWPVERVFIIPKSLHMKRGAVAKWRRTPLRHQAVLYQIENATTTAAAPPPDEIKRSVAF